MDLFNEDLGDGAIDALQTEQDRMIKQEEVTAQIESRKLEMDKRNKKMDKVNNRTNNAKSMVFQTRDAQQFMIMNRSTLEKLDAP